VGYLIGTDEAGYGPNLGPLVVSVSVWRVPPGVHADDLYDHLRDVVRRESRRDGEPPNERAWMADSKLLYRPGEGLKHLERGLWAAWAALDQRPDTWSEVWHTLAPDAIDRLFAEPWYSDYDCRAPFDAKLGDIDALGERLCEGMAANNIWLADLVSRPIFPKQFNEMLRQHESKGTALSHVTLGLVRDVVAQLDDEPISVVCDKHGGRDRYGRLLSEFFPDHLIEVRGESRQMSAYRFGPPHRRIEARFSAKAESFLPVALASMASKYLRELAMLAFNEFWCDRVAGLQSTAGYPQDAKRFKADIAEVQRKLELDDDMIWRNK
jgi:ribonuclease HII